MERHFAEREERSPGAVAKTIVVAGGHLMIERPLAATTEETMAVAGATSGGIR